MLLPKSVQLLRLWVFFRSGVPRLIRSLWFSRKPILWSIWVAMSISEEDLDGGVAWGRCGADDSENLVGGKGLG